MNSQEFSERAIRHGDQIIKPIDKLPEGVKEIYSGNEYIVGHSETGHHHVVAAPKLSVYELNGELYLNVEKVGEITHQKTFDKHETKIVQPGLYKVQVKQAFDYFQKKMTQVRD